MRKARFKMMLVGAVTAIALLFAGVNGLHAQTDTQDPFGSLPSGNFVGQAEAVSILASQVTTLKGVLQTLTPGTASFTTTERAAVYFNVIQVEVENGKDVPNSIMVGLEFAREYNSEYSQPGLNSFSPAGASFSELVGLRQQAIDLLSQ